jgi:hypothetical protein
MLLPVCCLLPACVLPAACCLPVCCLYVALQASGVALRLVSPWQMASLFVSLIKRHAAILRLHRLHTQSTVDAEQHNCSVALI